MGYFKFFLMLMLGSILSFNSIAANDAAMKEDNRHIRTWNGFADNALLLHEKLINSIPHSIKESLGGYAGNKDFYIEKQYLAKDTGKLISIIQWEKEKPTVLHSVEVFVRDKQGRVERDFLAAYLPGYHNAPVQALISFHQYSGKLHGFRSFDASGDKVLERCQGEHKGEGFEFLLDEDDLYAAYMNGNPIEEKVYELCVGKLAEKLGKYSTPQ